MKKIAVLGSCLSANVAINLSKTGLYNVSSSLNNVRLDAFLRYVYDRAALGAPESVISYLIEKSVVKNVELKHKQLSRRLQVQQSDRLAKFLDSLKLVDALIVDNQYDLSRSLVKFIAEDGMPYIFSNANLSNLDVKQSDLGLMGDGVEVDVYAKLLQGLNDVNPSMRVVFLQYPVSKYLGVKGYEEVRVKKARDVSVNMTKLPAIVFPLIRMEKNNLSEDNANHFKPEIYVLYAKAIDKVLSGTKLPFDPSVEIELANLERFCRSETKPVAPSLKYNPYQELPERQFWKRAVGDRYPLAINELYDKKFSISMSDGIATCGSCFAQHIGRRLKASGFNYLDVEKAPDSMPKHERVSHGYGIYSARYGNVYTSTQLLQLIERALGKRQFDEVWRMLPDKNGTIRYVDPFRPNLVPAGYATTEDLFAEQERHLAAVKALFSNLDIFIFTMGLTEYWYNKVTGAAYPISPGVTAGKFDPEIHGFRNLNYEETMRDMLGFIELMKGINPDFKMLLTVSPVPLTATAENRHVLVSTTHSKSILRAVAGELASRFDFIDYFPSYEIVMSPPFRGMFFQNNMRTVHDQGVDFVMSHFFSQHKPVNISEATSAPICGVDNEELCDEVFLELERMRM